MPPHSTPITVLFFQEGEAWSRFIARMQQTEGDVLLILSGREEDLLRDADVRKQFLAACKSMQQRLRIATKHPALAAEARGRGIRVLDRTKHVRLLLQHHPKLNEALRVFSPHLWRQQLKSRLQRMGLLSVPKLRIFSLVGLSFLLFYVVIFRLLPSADVRVHPRQESVSQTVNTFLVLSGALVDISERVRTMPLVPITVHFHHSMTFDHISKEFIGTSARLPLTVVNKSSEVYSLRKGTRFSNQAGMVFRIQEPAIVQPGSEIAVVATAEDVDLYGQIIGDRGNVPAGLKWDIPGLSPEERLKVYGENRKPGTSGTTSYRTVLKKEDLDLARKRLEQELLATAKQMIEEEREARNAGAPFRLEILQYQELTKTAYIDTVLPTQFLGEPVTSVPVEGGIVYSVYAYDQDAILAMLKKELISHVREGKRLLVDRIGRDNLDVRVVDYADDFSWIKLTVELIGTEEYILDPLSPTGALFGKKVRERIAGIHTADALRIVKNMPEVETAMISLWPPWNRVLPRIPSHISIVPQ